VAGWTVAAVQPGTTGSKHQHERQSGRAHPQGPALLQAAFEALWYDGYDARLAGLQTLPRGRAEAILGSQQYLAQPSRGDLSATDGCEHGRTGNAAHPTLGSGGDDDQRTTRILRFQPGQHAVRARK